MTDLPAKVLKVLEEGGYRYTLVDGQLHSIGDEPAVVYPNGTKFWYREGKLHRDGDKPAVVYPNGVEEWWQDHQRHRDNGPAEVFPDAPDILPESRGLKRHYRRGAVHHEEMPPKLRAYRNDLEALQRRHFGGGL